MTPLAEVRAPIRTQLVEQRKNEASAKWAADTEKSTTARSPTRPASSRRTRPTGDAATETTTGG